MSYACKNKGHIHVYVEAIYIYLCRPSLYAICMYTKAIYKSIYKCILNMP